MNAPQKKLGVYIEAHSGHSDTYIKHELMVLQNFLQKYVIIASYISLIRELLVTYSFELHINATFNTHIAPKEC